MKNNFTPGPWIVCFDGVIQRGKNQTGYSPSICQMPFETFKEMNDNPEIKANSRLIAASPDLLEACKLALKAFLTDVEEPLIRDSKIYQIDGALCGNALNSIRNAIQKAEGL